MLLPDDPKHFNQCHERWKKRAFRIHVATEDYPDEWLGQQCMVCKFYVPLVGAFIEDWGVCSNADSPADGMVRFEHDGCHAFEEGEQWPHQEPEPFPGNIRDE